MRPLWGCCQRRFNHPGPPYSVLFMGAGPVALPSLQALKADFTGDQRCVRDLQVVQPFPPPTRCSAAMREALEGLHIHQVKDPKTLRGWAVPGAADGQPFDLGVVVSFKYFLPARVIRGVRLGVINMHPSLLPAYRGAAPIQTALMNGDPETGVSIIRIEPQEPMDSGAVLLQRRVAVAPTAVHGELQATLGGMGAEAVMDTLHDFPALWESASRQPSEGMTFAPKITTQGLLRFATEDAHRVYNKWRALLDNGGVYAYFQRRGEEDPQRLKFMRLHFPGHLAPGLEHELRMVPAVAPGALYYPRWRGGAGERVVAVACAASPAGPEAVTWVVCGELALECRNVRTAADLAGICGWRGGELAPFDGEADCLVEVEDDEEGAEAG
eukprot:EG_transcript_13555